MTEPSRPVGEGQAQDAALRMLGRRALFSSEVAERLARRGFAAEVVTREIARLTRAGLLDDAELAKAVCRWELERGKGRRALSATLRRRGVGEELIAETLGAIREQDEEQALGVALARATRRHGEFAKLPRARAKVVRYLLARGFVAADVYRALARAAHEGTLRERGDGGDSGRT